MFKKWLADKLMLMMGVYGKELMQNESFRGREGGK